jgi:type IV secretion system protein TrbL
VNPNQWSMSAENQTMAGRGGAASGPPAGGGAGAAALPGAAATGGASGAGGAGASGGGSGAAAMAGIGFVLQKAHQAGTALSGRMEQTAAHGGMHGAYPYSTVSGGQRAGERAGGPRSSGGAPGEYADPDGQQPAAEAPPPQPLDSWPYQGPDGSRVFDDPSAPSGPGADAAEGG